MTKPDAFNLGASMFYVPSHQAWKFVAVRELKHHRILRMCGIRMAALYLRNRGYSVEQAVSLLLR